MGDFLKGLFGGSSFVKDTLDGIKGFITTDKDRDAAKIIIEKQFQDFQLKVMESADKFESEVTDRWKSDNSSDSVLAKNTRPLLAWANFILLAICIVCDSFDTGFHIKESWVSLIEMINVTIIAAYYGSRGAEKIFARKK